MLISSAIVEGASGYAQSIRVGGHAVTADEPASAGGTNTGPSPYGLLLCSLGACTSIALRMYADKKQWKLGTVRGPLQFFKAEEGDRIERTLHFEEPLTDEQRERLLEIAGKTPVTRTLMAGTAIHTKLG